MVVFVDGCRDVKQDEEWYQYKAAEQAVIKIVCFFEREASEHFAGILTTGS